MTINRHEDLIAWQLANQFKLNVYTLLDGIPPAQADHRFASQLRGSAASVGVNIAEGFYRYGRKEFSRYLSIALASLAEARLWVQDGIDRRMFKEAECTEAFALANRSRAAMLKLRQSLNAPPERK